MSASRPFTLFNTLHTRTKSTLSNMMQLPDDLLALLATSFTNKEKKILRLVNKRLHSFASPKINRVFISPSYKNIEVFQAIAAHPVFCKQVKEIVWDDARFEKFEQDDDDQSEVLPEDRIKNKHTFREAMEKNLGLIDRTEGSFLQAKASGVTYRDLNFCISVVSTEPVTDEKYMSLDESFELYNRLFDEQEVIIREGLDIAAFKDGLVAFTQLERVTVTSEAYRPSVINPCYPTPLIRSFPVGFNFPVPWPWMPECVDETRLELSVDDIRTHWRGITLVIDALAQSDRLIPEFIIDTRYEQLGVAYQFFDNVSEELQSFETLCERGLRRLDLAINTFPFFQNPGLRQLQQNHFKSVIAKATSLEHFSLHTNSVKDFFHRDISMQQNETMNALSAIPLESWPRLKHITLSSVPITYADLVEFLRRLPQSVQAVELINVHFTERTYKDLLERCRDDLHWTAGSPQLLVAYRSASQFKSRQIYVQEEVGRFFGGGHNPFEGQHSAHSIQRGNGRLRDTFDADYCKQPPVPRLSVFVSPGEYRWKTREEMAEENRVQEQQ